MPNVYCPITLKRDKETFKKLLCIETLSKSLQHPIIVIDPKNPIKVCIKNFIGECIIKYKSTFSHGDVH